MKGRTAVCPACGGPIEFQASSSLVTICEFCNSAVARGDKQVEDYGKVADLVITDSPLCQGMTGHFGGKPFTVVGRVQYAHAAGGVWDEWYLAFPSGRWGWLAEAQGKRYLMFRRSLSGRVHLPPFERLEVGGRIKFGRSEFTVTEKGVAKNAAAEGDIPWQFHPGGEHQYVDLSGPDETFATFEYSGRSNAYVGKEVTLEDLELDDDVQRLATDRVAVAALLLQCPQCGGQLTLHAPDKSERVSCPSCNSLLDATGGKLEYFATLKKLERLRLAFPIGTVGQLEGQSYTVIGFLRRFALYEGKTYPWSEYLLYSPDIGFRWLVENDRHWSFVKPLAAHAVSQGFSEVRYDGQQFKVYDRGTAYVRSVIGEFYWRVEVGEQVRTADYIAPPRMISFETTRTERSEEVNVSLGTYLPHEQVEKAFGVSDLTRPWSVGVIQPAPKFGGRFYITWGCFLVTLLVIEMIFSGSGADPWLMFYGMIFVSLIPAGILLFLHSFEVKRWENSDYSPYASDD